MNERRLPMHDVRDTDHSPAVHFCNALMAQTNAKYGNLFAKTRDNFFADARLVRRSWPGRNANVTRRQRRDLIDVNRIVSCDGQFAPKLAKVLGEVVGERVVIIQKQKH